LAAVLAGEDQEEVRDLQSLADIQNDRVLGLLLFGNGKTELQDVDGFDGTLLLECRVWYSVVRVRRSGQRSRVQDSRPPTL
jgi:hypothetical protein